MFVVVVLLSWRSLRSHDVFSFVGIVIVMFTIFTFFTRFIRGETGQSDVCVLVGIVQIEPSIDRETK